MTKKRTFFLFLLLAITFGIVIAWIDSNPKWDDAGISALMILVAAAICGYFSLGKPWLIALAIGIWIPLFSVLSNANIQSLLALFPALIGAYIGYFTRTIR